ncbi:MAG: dTDP-4-dehydrorhamnose 3,5-epimerase family protein [Rhodospirillales bacterium]|nr:dTDP-4-dehydrorhamnose 3,5-epimerase family protein [Rhodospirillales bacterium]MBO6787688.1 dTDP-4-dehydrorhamnose 3,5-epimerase family protein [Rhodospirillales bacterium]
MIDGVVHRPLRIIPDSRGPILHMLRNDSGGFAGFGEAYFTCIEPGAVKAWRKHTRMTMQLAVPRGLVEVVLFDARPGSASNGTLETYTLGAEQPDSYALLIIPPGIWNGFRGLSGTTSIIANCASLPHDPDEAERLDPDNPAIPHTWPPA